MPRRLCCVAADSGGVLLRLCRYGYVWLGMRFCNQFVIMYEFQPCRLAKSLRAIQNFSHCVHVINDGSPSRIRSVRRISLGMTTRPRSSMRRTMPVAFIFKNLPLVHELYRGIVCRKREIMQRQFLTRPARGRLAPCTAHYHNRNQFLCDGFAAYETARRKPSDCSQAEWTEGAL